MASAQSISSVVLRKLEPDDLPLLYRWENDTDSWLDGDTHNPLSHEDLREYILRTTGDIYQDGQLRLMICSSHDAEPVGCVDLYDVDIRNRKAAVAIYVAPEFRLQGRLNKHWANFANMRLIYCALGCYMLLCVRKIRHPSACFRP